MINPNKLRDFDAMLGICGPEYLFDIANEQISDYCLAKLESNNETAYIHNITVGNGIDKEYFCTATVTKPQKKAGWYICVYTDVKDDGYDKLNTHLFIPVIKPIRYIEDNLVCDDKSPLLIFLCICMHDFGYTHVTSFEGTPLQKINLSILLRACARLDFKISGAYNLSTLTTARRWRILNLFLDNEITVDMISTWIDPYNIGKG